ncbi:MAG: hypothetical protein KKA59_03020 [Candidatus Omnitrophica bacterium]|nr:hypothetical protein [Candidatus Omnitrophota bacterium]
MLEEKIAEQRSGGITIFSWLIIVGSSIGLIANFSPKPLNPAISVYFNFIILPLSIIAAINLLKLKNWPRIIIIIISILTATETGLSFSFVFKKFVFAYG